MRLSVPWVKQASIYSERAMLIRLNPFLRLAWEKILKHLAYRIRR
ncbi:MAG: hypothetical protein QXI87_07535 [Thermoproteota archaeon]